jgi:hypothetical protein
METTVISEEIISKLPQSFVDLEKLVLLENLYILENAAQIIERSCSMSKINLITEYVHKNEVVL